MKFKILSFSLILAFSSPVMAQSKTDVIVTITTPFGEMNAILFDETPKHKANFIKLAKEKYFDSLLFHRVIKNFMIQGGDPNSRNAKPGQGLGSGGPGYTVPAEILPQFFHKKGALSAARQGDGVNPKRESSGSQFYIVQGKVMKDEELDAFKYNQTNLSNGLRQMSQKPEFKPLMDSLGQIYSSNPSEYTKNVIALAPRIERATGLKVMNDVSPEKVAAYGTVGGTPHLDGAYTVFGQVIKGLDVIDKIAAVKTASDRPVEDVWMKISVQELSKKKITKLYGITYPKKK